MSNTRTDINIQHSARDLMIAGMVEGKEYRAGESLTFDARLGDEGPGSYTRINGYEITAEDIAVAAREAEKIR